MIDFHGWSIFPIGKVYCGIQSFDKKTRITGFLSEREAKRHIKRKFLPAGTLITENLEEEPRRRKKNRKKDMVQA